MSGVRIVHLRGPARGPELIRVSITPSGSTRSLTRSEFALSQRLGKVSAREDSTAGSADQTEYRQRKE